MVSKESWLDMYPDLHIGSEWLGSLVKDTDTQDLYIDELNHMYSSNKIFKGKIKRKMAPDKPSYLYLTLSPDKLLRNIDRTQSNLHSLNDWCRKWFNCDKKYYNAFKWVIESGSKGDHLHVHAICDLKTGHHHAEKLKKFWAKYYPNNQLLTTLNLAICYKCSKCKEKTCKNPKHRGEYCYFRFDDQDILKDKLEYFINSEKGTHENLYDENLVGSRGALY